MATYTTKGGVRGSCHHEHRTIRAALACVRADDRRCKRGNGPSAYSDRSVVRADGQRLTEAEHDLLEGLTAEM